MKLSLDTNDFINYVFKQCDNFFPDNQFISERTKKKAFDLAFARTEHCFKHISLKSYNTKEHVLLNHLHSDQYAVFLWFLSNSAWSIGEDDIASKVYYLNKVLHSFNCMYDTKLPDIFLLIHTIGTVLGKAEYSDFFIATQGCTVGAHHGIYPKLGKGVALLPNSSIVGDCTIGDNVSIGINATVYQKDINNNSVVYINTDGKLCLKHSNKPWFEDFFLKI